MCGRFSLISEQTTIEHRFGAKFVNGRFETGFFNAGPSMTLPIVRKQEVGSEKEIVLARWGLLPGWMPTARPQANARLDTIRSRKMFRDAFESRHCLVIADSFFEWRREKGVSQPYRVMRKDGGLFAMAAIWESASFPEEIPTFAILTTEANEFMLKIHDRMPVILEPEDERKWLYETGQGVYSNVRMEFPSEDMTMYPVSPKVNRLSYNTPAALEPVEDVKTLFA